MKCSHLDKLAVAFSCFSPTFPSEENWTLDNMHTGSSYGEIKYETVVIHSFSLNFTHHLVLNQCPGTEFHCMRAKQYPEPPE